jgi:peptidylprolyl isomerase
MSQAKKGDTVHIHYTGRFDDGTVFDTSENRDPLAFEIGKGMVVPGFEKAIVGMEVGDKKTETIPADQAYGPRVEQLTFMVPRENLPPGYDPQVGEVMRMETKDGRQMDVMITSADPEMVRMDANHPLAGKDLTFDIELMKIGE